MMLSNMESGSSEMSQIETVSAAYVSRELSPAKPNKTSRWSLGNLIVWSAFFVLIVAFILQRASEHRVEL
jgi:hypothetical protein